MQLLGAAIGMRKNPSTFAAGSSGPFAAAVEASQLAEVA